MPFPIHGTAIVFADSKSLSYRGRLAPSPTGFLHLGHARTFWIAAQRAVERGGQLILRNEDLDMQRCRPEFVRAMFEDLCWLGIEWAEGADVGGPFGPYSQSERRAHYLDAWRKLRESGMIYPCTCSRKDVAQSASAPNDTDDEPVYPGKCRPQEGLRSVAPPDRAQDPVPPKPEDTLSAWSVPKGVNWRFRVPDGEEISFHDLHLGPQRFVAGRDFGDFIVWRRDDVPAYQLAVVVDDAAMRVTEVVRGADLLRALELAVPQYYHCDLVRDGAGVRLAKRHDALSIRKLRELGWSAERVREQIISI
jgi:glutamyl/glutaminyl-tRNA synthetase